VIISFLLFYTPVISNCLILTTFTFWAYEYIEYGRGCTSLIMLCFKQVTIWKL